MDEKYASVESGSVSGGPPGRVVAVIVAAVGVAVLAFIGFRVTGAASGSAAGADTSSEAVTGLMGALSSENVIEIFALLPPSEVGHVVELYVPGVELAQESEVIVSDDPLAGIDITIEGTVTRVEELHSDIHRVYLSNDAIVRVVTDPTKMDPALAEQAEASVETITAQELLEEFNDRDDPDPLSELFVVAVRERGQWFASPLYTTMEYLREYYDVDVPDFAASREVVNVGAESPEGVLEQFLEPIDELDETDVIEGLDQAIAGLEEGSEADYMADVDWETSLIAPDEIDVFLDYAPVFAAITEEIQMSTDEIFGPMEAIEVGEAIPEMEATTDYREDWNAIPEAPPPPYDCPNLTAPDGTPACDPWTVPAIEDPYFDDDSYYDDFYYEEPLTLTEQLEEMRNAFEEADYKGNLDIETETMVESMSDDRARVSVTAAQLRGELSWQDPGMPRSSVVLDAEIYDGICGRYSFVQTDVVEYEGAPPESFTESADECLEIPGDRPAGAFIITREIDGQWYFSPIETIIEYARFAIEIASAED
ncbi:MAG: hypothetical protein IH940_00065 [Acidobacteria bacterium]|nr:hypothetical protein [Acidobacteriota bacterium]